MTQKLTLDQTRFLTRINYQFDNPTLFLKALTHRSVHKTDNYERLEFLGDALLSAVIADHLFNQFPNEQEGRLTRKRATLVRQETLAKVARDLDLGRLLNLGLGERKAGGRHRDSILSDVVEALLGAIYLDSGQFTTVQRIILQWFAPYLKTIDDTPVLKDAKSRLQERLQANKHALPTYNLLKTEGKAPDQVFHVSCDVSGIKTCHATGKSRRIAEQNAAKIALEQLDLDTKK